MLYLLKTAGQKDSLHLTKSSSKLQENKTENLTPRQTLIIIINIGYEN